MVFQHVITGSANLRRDEALTGRAALTFDVRRNISVYGLFAQSFEPVFAQGGVVILDPDTGQIVGTERRDILEPETGEIFEIGIKTDWFDGKLGVNAAVFRLERDKIPIARDLPPGIPGFSISAGLQRSGGVELEINGQPLPGWNLSFGGTLLDSEFMNGPFEGSRPQGSADWQVGLFTSYELQTGPLQGLGAGIGLYAIDDRGDSIFVPNSSVEGYERVDLSLFYNGLRNTEIALQVRNVFDETYIEGAGSTSTGAFFGSPTVVLLTVLHNFGK